MPNYYNTGTVSVNNGATTVTLAGGLWSGVLQGDSLILDGRYATIASLTDATHLELANAWSGTTQSGAAYLVRFDAPSRFTSGYLAEQVRALVARAGILEAARPNYEIQTLGDNTPPGSPVEGDMYVVGTSPTGAWAGEANKLAQWTGSAWLFTAADHGVSVVSVATGVLSIWNGSAWLPYVAPSTFMQTLLDDTTAAEARATLGGTAFRAMGTLTGAAGSFARFTGTGGADAVMQSIVGTVSQSAGVPTGAIVERGSNANGEYVRYADGTQICWRTTSGTTISTTSVANGLYRTDLQPVSFPATFAANPFGIINIGAGNGWMGSLSGVNTTQWTYQLLAVQAITSGATNNMQFLAIGRWF